MDAEEDVGESEGAREEEALEDLLVPPAAILESLPDAVVAAKRDGRIVFVNALAEELFGYPRAELLGQPVHTLWPVRVRERYNRNMELYFATEHPLRFSTVAWGLRRDGSEFIGEMSWGILTTPGDALLLAVGRDISERRAAEARLRAVASIAERALAGADPVDLAGQAIALLRTLLPIKGAEVRMADGSSLATSDLLTDPDVRVTIGNGEELLLAPERPLDDGELSFVRAAGSTLGTALKRLRNEERTRYEALHDPLTGLANRTLLRDRLEHALARSVRERGATALMFIDFDNFKQVNDAHGHGTGDAVLVEMARRLQGAIRPGDTIARLGGDEFVAVCEGIDQEALLAVGSRLLDAIHDPLAAGGAEHRLSASIGIAFGDVEPDALLEHADAATYRAKAAGGGRIELYR